jgi:death-on-curing protein
LSVVFLSLAEVLEIHQDQIARYGGQPGTRDLNLLKSALAVPSATFGGNFLHGEISEMAAAYLFHLVKNHPFLDGNKRVGTMAAYTFLALNGYELDVSSEVLFDFVTALAAGERRKADAALFFREHTRLSCRRAAGAPTVPFFPGQGSSLRGR